MIGRNYLEVVGKVRPSRSVIESANIFRKAVHFFTRHILRRLEHQVLEQMSETRTSGRVVLSAHVVPKMDRNSWTRIVLNRNDTQSVGEGSLLDGQGRYFDLTKRTCCQTKKHESN